MLFVTALAAVGLVLTHADGVSQAAREESHAVAHGAPLPRLHEVVADLLARSEAHEGPAPPTTPAR